MLIMKSWQSDQGHFLSYNFEVETLNSMNLLSLTNVEMLHPLSIYLCMANWEILWMAILRDIMNDIMNLKLMHTFYLLWAGPFWVILRLYHWWTVFMCFGRAVFIDIKNLKLIHNFHVLGQGFTETDVSMVLWIFNPWFEFKI